MPRLCSYHNRGTFGVAALFGSPLRPHHLARLFARPRLWDASHLNKTWRDVHVLLSEQNEFVDSRLVSKIIHHHLPDFPIGNDYVTCNCTPGDLENKIHQNSWMMAHRNCILREAHTHTQAGQNKPNRNKPRKDHLLLLSSSHQKQYQPSIYFKYSTHPRRTPCHDSPTFSVLSKRGRFASTCLRFFGFSPGNFTHGDWTIKPWGRIGIHK